MTWAWEGDGALVQVPSLVIAFLRPFKPDEDRVIQEAGPALAMPNAWRRPHPSELSVVREPIHQWARTVPHMLRRRYLRPLLLAASILSSQPTVALAQPLPSPAASGLWQQQAPAPAHPQTPPRPLITAHPPPGPQQQQQTPDRSRSGYAPPPSNAPHSNGQHLGSWLAGHQNQSVGDQQRSLQQEPGFSRLPQPQQQRLLNHLQQLDSMPPQQRQRTLNRIENMERLSPAKRQEVRGAAQQMGQLPPDRKQSVQRAFRELRSVPPAERQQMLDSPEYRSQYSGQERGILSNLLSVEPYQPR
jgi:hypothetical protein